MCFSHVKLCFGEYIPKTCSAFISYYKLICIFKYSKTSTNSAIYPDGTVRPCHKVGLHDSSSYIANLFRFPRQSFVLCLVLVHSVHMFNSLHLACLVWALAYVEQRLIG